MSGCSSARERLRSPLDLRAPSTIGERAQHRRNLQRVVDPVLVGVRLAHQHQRSVRLSHEQALHGRQRGRLILRDQRALAIAAGEELPEAGDGSDDHAGAQKRARRSVIRAWLGPKVVVRAETGGREGARHRRTAHGVEVLPEGPTIEEQRRQAAELDGAVRRDAVPDGMLHPSVGRHDEVAGEPGAEKHGHRRRQVRALGEPFLAEQEQAEEGRFEEEGEHPLHRQRLADHAAREAREPRPVGSELELHGNAGDDAEDEVDGEQSTQDTRGLGVAAIGPPDRHHLADDDQRGEAHGQLREQIVKGGREGEMQTMNDERAVQGSSFGCAA